MSVAPPAFQLPAALSHRGLRLRPEVESDEPFLFALYASTRAEELAAVPWSDEQKGQFLHMQFTAQTAHYTANFPDCDRRIIERDGQSIGRLYLDLRKVNLHIIDIALLPAARGAGLGGSILEALAEYAAPLGRGLGIFVEKANPALRLYQRLGFLEVADAGVYLEMEWPRSSS